MDHLHFLKIIIIFNFMIGYFISHVAFTFDLHRPEPTAQSYGARKTFVHIPILFPNYTCISAKPFKSVKEMHQPKAKESMFLYGVCLSDLQLCQRTTIK